MFPSKPPDVYKRQDQANLRNMTRICGGDPEGKIHLLMDYTDPVSYTHLMQDGTFTYVDEKEYLAAIPQYPDTIGERAAEEFFAINGTNAHFMREDKL